MINSQQPSCIIHTDGSGWNDGICGYCAVVKFRNEDTPVYTMGCMSHSTVARSELQAIVEGLKVVFNSNRFFDGIKVEVFTDSKTTAGCAMNNYKKIEHRDLWLQYEYYAEKMEVSVYHILRNETGENKEADVHASTLRIILQEYILNSFHA